MKEITKVVVDAMGGDNAPHEIIKGAVEAVGKSDAIHVILVGKEDVINQELSGYTYNKEQISVVHTSEVIETAEPPVTFFIHYSHVQVELSQNRRLWRSAERKTHPLW